MKLKRKKFLSIEEKRKLIYEGKTPPICVGPDREARRRKIEQKKAARRFSKFLNT